MYPPDDINDFEINDFSDSLYKIKDANAVPWYKRACVRAQKLARNIYWSVYYIFHPESTKLKKSMGPEWYELSEVIVQKNFEAITNFYENYICDTDNNWVVDLNRQQFAHWCRDAYKYITIDRPQLLAEIKTAYPTFKCPSHVSYDYEELFGLVEKLECELNRKDTRVLTELILKRDSLHL